MSASLPASTEAERGGSKLLWFGVLIGPLCWSLQILIGYNLEEIACNPGSSTQKIDQIRRILNRITSPTNSPTQKRPRRVSADSP